MKKITHLGTHKKIKIFSLLSAFYLLLSASFAQTWPPAGMQGAGTSGSPWEITTPAHLKALADYVNATVPNANSTEGKYYKMMNNIDLSGYATGEGWTPIGRTVYTSDFIYFPFKGNFNGNNNKITGLYINSDPNAGYNERTRKGLFGYTNNKATIENMGVENGNIICIYYDKVGGIVGDGNGCVITNCWFTGSVSANNAGGIVGDGNGCVITNCWFSGSVTGGRVGGIMSSGSGKITKCYSEGEINGYERVGGIAGSTTFSSDNGGTITNCYSTCTVSGNSFVGGIVGGTVGYASGTVTNCYSTGAVIAENTYVGGITGNIEGDYYNLIELNNCVALNPSVKFISDKDIYVGRVYGKVVYCTPTNNAAFEGLLNKDNNTTWNNKGADKKDGADMTAAAILADGTLGGRFTAANGWTIQNGKLPGLFGNTVDMPAHITGGGGTTYTIIASSSANGTINPSGVVTVPEGTDKTFTITPNTDYQINEVLVDGSNVPAAVANGTYTFTNVKANHTIAVSFKQESWPPAGMKGNGTENNPWLIETPLHLRKLAVYVNNGNGNETKDKYYKVVNNLNMSEYAAGEGWEPIGNGQSGWAEDQPYAFQGNLNGNGKKITELKINRPAADHVGLFGVLLGAVIENLGIENANVTGKAGVGGLVDASINSKIVSCYVTGNITGSSGTIGGLVGIPAGSTIINCYTSGTVKSTTIYGELGGLVGHSGESYNFTRVTIRDCYSSCQVNSGTTTGGLVGTMAYTDIIGCYATGEVSGCYYSSGGLVGSTDHNSIITNCYATGKVTKTVEDNAYAIGGLVGTNYNAQIIDCHATGLVTGYFQVGGLVGHNTLNGIIMGSYSTGNVRGKGGVGGLVGYNENTINVCYASGNVNSILGCGGLVGTNGNSFFVATISNCYATGNVSSTGGSNAGGLVGWNNNGSINYCYTTGKIIGSGIENFGYTGVGGLVGENYNFSENSFIRNSVVVNDSIIIMPANSVYAHWYAGTHSKDDNGNFYSKISYNYIYKEVVCRNRKPLEDTGENPFLPKINTNEVKDWDALTSASFYTNPDNWFGAWDFVNIWTMEGGKGIEQLPRFKQKSYTITASAGANGTINPAGELTVPKGESRTYTITANSGYEIDKVLVDDENYYNATVTGTYTFVNVGSNHTIAASFRLKTGIKENPVENRIKVYPNPTTGQLTIDNEELTIKSVSIFDIYGRKVGGKFPSNSLEGWQPQADGVVINISHLPCGIYFLQIHTEQGTVNKKIVKQ